MSGILRSVLVKTAIVLPLFFSQWGTAQTLDQQSLQAQVNRWADAFNREDSVAIANEYAPDAVLYSAYAHEPTTKGNTNIGALFPEHFKVAKNLKITVSDFKVLSPDLVQGAGEWTAELKGDKPGTIGGRWYTLLQKSANNWPIITHMISLILPAQAQEKR